MAEERTTLVKGQAQRSALQEEARTKQHQARVRVSFLEPLAFLSTAWFKPRTQKGPKVGLVPVL